MWSLLTTTTSSTTANLPAAGAEEKAPDDGRAVFLLVFELKYGSSSSQSDLRRNSSLREQPVGLS